VRQQNLLSEDLSVNIPGIALHTYISIISHYMTYQTSERIVGTLKAGLISVVHQVNSSGITFASFNLM